MRLQQFQSVPDPQSILLHNHSKLIAAGWCHSFLLSSWHANVCGVQVARAVEGMLGDEEGEAEQMVAVLDARQATTLQVTRKVNLIKKLALDLNQVSHMC